MTNGSFTLHTGPMGAGKTFALLMAAYKAEEEGRRVVCLQSAQNTRDNGVIRSRGGLERAAEIVSVKFTRAQILRIVGNADFIGVDEVHLFRELLIDVLLEEYLEGKEIVFAGIDTDYRGKPLSTPLYLMSKPETVIQRHPAVCAVCTKRLAHRSQRLRNGDPVSRKDPIVLIEGADEGVTYRAVCLKHHILKD